jgi:hypothetical protein
MAWEGQKKEGNRFFGEGKFVEAVGQYGLALNADMPSSDRSTLLNNRAMCHIKLKQFQSAVEDCTASLMHTADVATAIKSYYRRCAAGWP